MPRSTWQHVRYAAALAFVVAWAAAYAHDGVWYGDFWAHAAVVRELAAHPLAPGHPQLAVDAPHAFFSPYAWAVAIAARITGADALHALAIAGVLNALLLGLALLALCRTLFGSRAPAVAFWSLVLILFWWGDGEWFWSGFLHAQVFGYVVAYPSTFALIASFFALALTPRWLTGSVAGGLGVLSLLVVVLLTHPVTAVFTMVGMAAMGFERLEKRPWRMSWIGLAVVGAIGAAALWPLYPFLRLFVTDHAEFHARSRELYQDLWPRTYPVLLGIPLLLVRLRRRRRDVLAVSVGALMVVYGIGYVSGRYGLGRVVSPVAILVQIALARELVRLEEHLASMRVKVGYVLALGSIVWIAAKSHGPLEHVFHRRANDYAQYAILDGVRDDDVVLADLLTSWPVPAFGPKIVASEKPLYWVSDLRTRREDVTRFFAPSTSDAERRAIVDGYGVTYVLVEANKAWTPPDWMRPVHRNAQLVLYQVTDPATGAR